MNILEPIYCTINVILLYQYSRLNKESFHNCFCWQVVQVKIKALLLNPRKSFFILSIFTCIFNQFFNFTVTFYDVYIILQAFVLTTGVFLGLTMYTLQSKRDFSKFGAG